MTRLLALLGEIARSMVGVPSYDAYRAHLAERHPEAAPMDRRTFFRERQRARYRGGGGRCC